QEPRRGASSSGSGLAPLRGEHQLRRDRHRRSRLAVHRRVGADRAGARRLLRPGCTPGRAAARGRRPGLRPAARPDTTRPHRLACVLAGLALLAAGGGVRAQGTATTTTTVGDYRIEIATGPGGQTQEGVETTQTQTLRILRNGKALA